MFSSFPTTYVVGGPSFKCLRHTFLIDTSQKQDRSEFQGPQLKAYECLGQKEPHENPTVTVYRVPRTAQYDYGTESTLVLPTTSSPIHASASSKSTITYVAHDHEFIVPTRR